MNLKKVDYNVEFCHIYSDEVASLSEKQRINLLRTKAVIDNLVKSGSSFCLTALIDNYSEGCNVDFDKRLFLQNLEEFDISPDFIVMEADLTFYAEKLIETISDKWIKKMNNQLRFISYLDNINLRDKQIDINTNETEDYVLLFMKDKGLIQSLDNLETNFEIFSDINLKSVNNGEYKYSCTLLTACWHLFRLGIDNFTDSLSSVVSYSEKPFFGERSMTILPIKYLKIEANAYDILSFSKNNAIKKARKRIEYVFH